MKQPSFDEMQMTLRYQISGQGFTLMTLLLLLDYISYMFGLRWIPYPDNLFAIVVICCSFVTIRRIMTGCYVAPGKTLKNVVSRPLIVVFLTIMVIHLVTGALLKTTEAPAVPVIHASPSWMLPLCYLLLAVQGFAYLWFVWREQRHRNDE